jgi:hypothetical protein
MQIHCLKNNEFEVGDYKQFWSIQGVMIEGDLVKLKTRYPIWLYSYGLSDGDLGIISKMEDDNILGLLVKDSTCRLC